MHSDAIVLSAPKFGLPKIWQEQIFFHPTLAMIHSVANVMSSPPNSDLQGFCRSQYFFAGPNYDAFRRQCDVLSPKIGTSKDLVRDNIFSPGISYDAFRRQFAVLSPKIQLPEIWQEPIFFR